MGRAGHPFHDGVGPGDSPFAGRVYMVFLTRKHEIVGVEEGARRQNAFHKGVVAFVFFPVGRTDPEEGDITYFGEQTLYIRSAAVKVFQEKLVASQCNHDKVGTITPDEIVERITLAPGNRR